MLGKLIKHEYKATARLIVPAYGILILFTAVERGVLAIMQHRGLFQFGAETAETAAAEAQTTMGTLLSIFGGISLFVYILTLLAVVFLTIFFVVQRFYKNLLTDEGYLSFTLPVTPTAQVGAKLITGLSWTILSFLLVALSLTAMFYQPGLLPQMFDALRQSFLEQFTGATPRDFSIMLGYLLVTALFSVTFQLLLFYTSIAVGHLISAQHKILASFAAYLVITTAVQFLFLAVIFVLGFGMGMLTGDVLVVRQFYVLLSIALLGYAVLDVILFSATASIFKKRLNLE